ncbi:MAG TPA: iron uptake porin, partial [Allocoleopsis sp.]
MSKIFWMALRVSPAILGALLGLAHSALSSEATVVGIAPNQIVAATDKPTSFFKQNIHTQEPNTPTLETPLSQQLDVNPISVLKKNIITAEALVPETALTQLVPTGDQPASALEQRNQYTQEPDNLSQVTNVSQLRDVQPGDWAYEALRSLVERYGCIAGYPDGTFRGNRAMTRYEFAAGLNACLTQIEKLIATSTA